MPDLVVGLGEREREMLGADEVCTEHLRNGLRAHDRTPRRLRERLPHAHLSASLPHRLVDVAPLPVLARLERADHGMLRRVKVFRRVLVLRVVAAADMPARLTVSRAGMSAAATTRRTS